MQHSFDIGIAKKYGVQAAVILNHLYFWIEKNKANGANFYDGQYWTYNSKRAFTELFPYMTERQIDYALKKMVDDGLIVKGNYNEVAYDRTLWYSITKKGYSIIQNCEMEETKLTNATNKIVQPIPYNNTDIEEKENIKDNSFIKEKEPNLISGVNLKQANNSINHSNVDSQTLEFSIGARFKKPTVEQVAEYCKERSNGVDAEGFVNFYEAKGWKIGKSPMKDWKAAVRTWERNRKQVNKTYGKTPNTASKCTTLTINEVLDIRTANSNKGEVEYE